MKTVNLLGSTVEMVEARGHVLDTNISHRTHTSGGGYVGKYGGTINVNSHTSSETKIYLDVDGREQAYVVPGDYELRKGHEISVIAAKLDARIVPTGILNHSLGKSQWRDGSLVAANLGLLEPSKLIQILQYLGSIFVGGFVAAIVFGGVVSVWFGLLAGIAMLLRQWLRKRSRTRLSNQAISDFFREQ